ERGLARSRTGHDADHANASLSKPLTQFARDEIVLLENAFAYFDDSWAAHGSISIRTILRSCFSPSSITRAEPSAAVPSQASLNENNKSPSATPASGPS